MASRKEIGAEKRHTILQKHTFPTSVFPVGVVDLDTRVHPFLGLMDTRVLRGAG